MTDKSLKSKSVKVKGGASYAMVKDRVLWLDANKSGAYSIDTKHWFYPEQRTWVVKAVLTVDGHTFSGHAQEVESNDARLVNYASALENCETSAIGRACAAYGLGIQDSYASADEVHKAERATKPATDKQIKTIYDTVQRLTGHDNKEDMDTWLKKAVGGTPEQFTTKSAGTVLFKLFEAEKQKNSERPAELDEVLTDLPDEINLDAIPY